MKLGALVTAGAIACVAAGRSCAQTAESQTANAAPLEMPMPAMDNQVLAHLLFNQLEGRTDGGSGELRWDGEGWIGTDMNRAWFKSEGFADDGTVGDGDVEALYDRPLPRVRYFDGQVGVREDVDSGPYRTWLALGVEGLAPGFFELEPTVYFRDKGHVAGRITSSYDVLITERLIAQPELEMNFYSKSDLERRLGTGLSDLDTGLRVRYEISRKWGPYWGFAYTRDFGGTARLSREVGESTAEPRFVFGLRVWH
jgi:copper resistance protein B